MCGIAGIIDFLAAKPQEGLLRRMLGFIRHRGPDAFGIYTDNEAGLAHARLSIVDLSGGDQPIHNEDRTVWVVYNGEIFNYPELRHELEKRGHQFYTRTDTEILVHLYEERGPDLFKDVNGQFAFALWDQRKKRLLLGRDRLGIRPLFYYHDGKRLVFGSEVKALFADSRIPRVLDPQAISDVFTCWAPLGPLTAFQGVRQLPPGHYAVFSPAGLVIRPYWQLSFAASGREDRCDNQLTEELQHLLLDATRIRLRADVPVGAYLSGGLDSTCITSLVKRFFDNHLRTFSVSFTDSHFDEAPFQAKAVQALQTEHRSIRCSEQDIGENFRRVVWHAEVPLLQTFFSPEMQGLIKKQAGFLERFCASLPPDFMTWDPLSRAQYTEISIFLSNYLLASQGDRVAMAHAVEGRYPFLDYRVVEFACALPPTYRLRGLQDKRILRKVATGLMPPALAHRPKQPYRAPISRCFFGSAPQEYVSDLLSEQAIRQSGYFDAAKVARLVEKCHQQEGSLTSERENMALVGILSTQLLDDMFVRHFPPSPAQELKDVKVIRVPTLATVS